MDLDTIDNLASSIQDRLDTMGLHAIVGYDENDLETIDIDINGRVLAVDFSNVEFTDSDDDIYELSINATIGQRGRSGDSEISVVVKDVTDLGLAFAVAAAAH